MRGLTVDSLLYPWTLDELLFMWPVFGILSLVALYLLFTKLRAIRAQRHQARGIVLDKPLLEIPPAPDRRAYFREEWLRDMESDLTIEEISFRVRMSNGAWRSPRPADPTPPPASSRACAGGPPGNALSVFSSVLGGLALAPLVGSLLAGIKRDE